MSCIGPEVRELRLYGLLSSRGPDEDGAPICHFDLLVFLVDLPPGGLTECWAFGGLALGDFPSVTKARSDLLLEGIRNSPSPTHNQDFLGSLSSRTWVASRPVA